MSAPHLPAPVESTRRASSFYLAQALIFWRGVRGMSQERLASAAGVSLSTVKWFERGRKNAPRLDTLERLCAALEISTTELLERAHYLEPHAMRRG